MEYSILTNSIWVALCAMLVLLMNFGLAFFYAGLVSGRNALNTIKMSVITLGIIPLVWWVVGYSLVFSGNGPFWGGTDLMFLAGIDIMSVAIGTKVLSISFICFQAMFASIAPAIVSGSGVERLKFSTYLIFIVLWILAVYCTIAHSVWDAHGWAANFGAFDFAGGVVVHVSAGFSGLALAMALQPRCSASQGQGKHNLPFMVLGCGLLWFGWFGFNAGSSLDISTISLLAVANTLFATSASMVAWLICDFTLGKNRSVTGICSSLIIGLVAITPSAGYVAVSSAIAIGAISSLLSYLILSYYYKMKHAVDDTLDVFACHGVPGFLGGIMVGVFASHEVNPQVPDGLLYGSWVLLYKQTVVTIVVALFSFCTTFLLLYLLKITIGLRVTASDELAGLDMAEHGESAYSND